MSLPKMPYIEFATENYIHPKYNLAKSDVSGPELSEIINANEFFDLLSLDPYGLLKKLRSVMAKKYCVTGANIEFSVGVTNSFYMVSQIMKDLGHSRVLSESPGYEPFWLTPKGVGLEVDFFERNSDDYSIDLEKLEKMAHEGDWLWLSNPHNPSGRYLNTNEIKEIADVLKKKNAYLFVDEIYHDFMTPLGVDSAVNLGENIIISSSFTKTYGLGTLKLGWIVGPEHIIERATISRLHQCMLIPGPSLALMILFMDLHEQYRLKNIKKVHQNMELIRESFSSEFLSSVDGGTICLLKLEDGINDVEFAKSAVKNEGLVLAPGYFFRKPGYLRVSAAGDFLNVEKALYVLKNLLNSF